VEGVKIFAIVGFIVSVVAGGVTGGGVAGADRGERKSLPSCLRSGSSSTSLRRLLVLFDGGD
jgi:hypothetical protein